MFKLILILSFLDAGGEAQTRQMQYRIFFPSIAECQEQVRESMSLTESIIQEGGEIIGVSYTCVYDPNLIGAETEV